MQYVDGNRIGGDLHPNLIALLSAAANGWIPPETVTEQEYKDAKARDARGEVSAIIGYIGFPCSYGGKYFGGLARGGFNSKGPRDHTNEAYRNAMEQFPKLYGVKFVQSSYDALTIPPYSIIYCDPPYRGTQPYSVDSLDHDSFWQWVRERAYEGHKVFVSEYSAPNDFVCVWSKTVNNTLDKDTGAKSAVEKLFVHESQHGR